MGQGGREPVGSRTGAVPHVPKTQGEHRGALLESAAGDPERWHLDFVFPSK